MGQRATFELEEAGQDELIRRCLARHHTVRQARWQAYIDAYGRCTQDLAMPLTDAERLIEATIYDIKASKSVNADKLYINRSSVREALALKHRRNLALLQALLMQPEADSSAADKVMTAKEEVVNNHKHTNILKEQMKALQSSKIESTKEQRNHASKVVYERLLQIMDELVPETVNFATETSSLPVPADRQRVKEQTSQVQEALGQLSVVDQQLKTVLSSTRDDQPLFTAMCAANERQGLTFGAVKSRLPKPSSFAVDSHLLATDLFNVQRKLKIDQDREFLAEVQTLHAKSSELSAEAMIRYSTESPLLASESIPSNAKMNELARLWRTTAAEKANAAVKAHEERQRAVMEDLQIAEDIRNKHKQLKQDYEAYVKLDFS